MPSILIKVSAILWIIWGVVHTFAGIIVISSDAAAAVKAIADGVSADLLTSSYSEAANAVINQHG